MLEQMYNFYPKNKGQDRTRSLLHQFLRIMKITTFILIAVILHVSATSLAQKVTLVEKNAPLIEVFDKISTQTGYDFLFTSSDLKNAKPVTINFKNTELREALQQIFQGQNLDFTIEDKSVVIKEKQNTAPNKPQATSAQITVQGKVQDETGQPMLGVTVTIKGTNQSVPTDKNGAFRITVPDENTILVFSFVGYEPQELRTRDIPKGSIISLKTSNTNLKEVLVNKGFYTERADLSTGSTAKVSAKDIGEQPVTSLFSTLEGRIPGFDIRQTSGVPGRFFNYQIRGRSSIGSGNNPLFIVDGVPFYVFPSGFSTFDNQSISSGVGSASDPLSSIDPADIESVEVLKDADATSIYGTRGANGVVLITTKKAKVGKTKIEFNVSQGIGKATNITEMLNTQQYLNLRRQAFKNDGVSVFPSDAYDVNGVWDTTRYTNWSKLAMGGTAKYTDVQGTFSGGTSQLQYLLGGGFHKETTIYPGGGNFQRGAFHSSISYSSIDRRFQLNFDSFSSLIYNISPLMDPGQMLRLPPDAPAIFNGDGTLNWANSTWLNPFGDLNRTSRSNTYNTNNGLNISYRIAKGLVVKSNLGFTWNSVDQLQKTPITAFDPANIYAQSSALIGNVTTKTWIFEPQIDYTTKLWGGNLNALFGGSLQQQSQNSTGIQGTGFSNDALLENITAATTVTVLPLTYVPYKYSTAHFRVGYNYGDKYVINITASRDGSSRFGSNKQFANFGSLGAAWIFSNESFIKDKLAFLSFGKLRASYGTTGNDQIGDYQFLNTYSTLSLGNTYFGSNTLFPSGLPNPEFGWETTKKFEIGLDFRFVADKISLSADYYRNASSDQLTNYVLPSFTGGTSILENFPATLRNSGVELQLSSTNINKKNFRWTTSFNITIPVDEGRLVAFPNLINTTYASYTVVGQPIGTNYWYHFTGVNPQTGLYTFEDHNKDGNLNGFNVLNGDAYSGIFQGKQYYGGLQNTIRLGNWELGAFFQFSHQRYGNSIYSGTNLPGSMNNIPQYLYDRMWRNPGDLAIVQKASNSNSAANTAYYNLTQSDGNFTDATFLRLRTASLAYQFPGRLIQAMHINSLRIYMNAQNLFTLTGYPAADPETQNLYSVPPLRMIVAGVQIGL